MLSPKFRHHAAALSLIEMLVVAAIIAVVVGLLLPGIQKARIAGYRTQCQSNMRQLGIALYSANDSCGSLPPWWTKATPAEGAYTMNVQGVDWTYPASTMFYILPFIDQGNLMFNWLTSNATDSGALPSQSPPKLFLCPSDPSGVNLWGINPGSGGYAVTNYVTNYQVWLPNEYPNLTNSFGDGLSNTAWMFERWGNCGNSGITPNPWFTINNLPNSGTTPSAYGAYAYAGVPSPSTGWSTGNSGYAFPVFQVVDETHPCDPTNTQGLHLGENVLMGDGSVHLVSMAVSVTSWNEAITPNGGEVGPSTDF